MAKLNNRRLVPRRHPPPPREQQPSHRSPWGRDGGALLVGPTSRGARDPFHASNCQGRGFGLQLAPMTCDAQVRLAARTINHFHFLTCTVGICMQKAPLAPIKGYLDCW